MSDSVANMNEDNTPLQEMKKRFRRSLSAGLIALTILFVFTAEAVVLVPSISQYRVNWLNMRVESAYLVGLALDSPKGEMITPAEAEDLLATAGVQGVAVDREGARYLILAQTIDPTTSRVRHFVDLRDGMTTDFFSAPWEALFSKGDDLMRIYGRPRYAQQVDVDLIVSEAALRRDLWVYTRNVFFLSLAISTITALLVYTTLNRMIVAPVKRLTHNMMAFEAHPEDPANIISPQPREDEIGAAERGLEAMQHSIQSLLAERRQLAALGAGISKISHDLRNILASAQLMSDRLAKSDDPRVRKLSPRLIASLDRAIALSRDTLSYARMDASALNVTKIELAALIDEVFEDTASMHIEFENKVARDLLIEADSGQLYRALFNIVRNAVDALSSEAEPSNDTVSSLGKVAISASVESNACIIEITDNGPGIPEQAQAHLFEPFKGSLKPGGSGLGIAIAHEIVRAHHGALELASTGPEGTVFRMTLPVSQS